MHHTNAWWIPLPTEIGVSLALRATQETQLWFHAQFYCTSLEYSFGKTVMRSQWHITSANHHYNISPFVHQLFQQSLIYWLNKDRLEDISFCSFIRQMQIQNILGWFIQNFHANVNFILKKWSSQIGEWQKGEQRYKSLPKCLI